MQKYCALGDYLVKQCEVSVSLTFEQVEQILGLSLPRSAYAHRAWWANTLSHPQAKSWLRVGWKVSNVNLEKKNVIYGRTICVLDSKLSKNGEDTSLVISVGVKDITLILSGTDGWFSATYSWHCIIQMLLNKNPHMFGHLTEEPDHYVIPENLAKLGYSVFNRKTGQSWKPQKC